jgi:hypothetical protein
MLDNSRRFEFPAGAETEIVPVRDRPAGRCILTGMRYFASVRLSMGAVLGLVLGVSVQCGATSSGSSAACSSDSDCVLACTKNTCCTGSCPCNVAKTRAARQQEQRESGCDEKKVDCGQTRREECDWSTHYRAACRSGACVAEPLAADAAASLGPRDTPTTITATDPRAAQCRQSRKDECWFYETVSCDADRKCTISVPCEPAACERAKAAAPP